MKLIADSGSSHTDWLLLKDNGEHVEIKTGGINPYYQSSEAIFSEIEFSLVPLIGREVEEIYFYGAGCLLADKSGVVKYALGRCFPKAKVEVNSDLIGAARAVCGQNTGIVCALGTGSNSCLYDGNKILEQTPSLGFVIGDEGGASYLGRHLVADYFRGLQPLAVTEKFKEAYNLTREELLQNIYTKNFPNRYLGNFAKFVSENVDEEYCYNLAYECFLRFFKRNIYSYSDFRKHKIYMVGSVAWFFQDIIRKVLCDEGLILGEFLHKPINRLADYHSQK